MQELHKILIANRGEIAVRIIRTVQSLGYDAVAIFSDADADAPHVSLADEAVHIGPSEVGASYLNGERIIQAALKTGADGIHPGYGFLSENPDFARAVTEAGLTWIGPPPEAMEIMGNKAAAKIHLAQTAPDVPTVPGYSSEAQSDEAFLDAANGIGFPIMVKAAAGGGGRGMRLVLSADDLPAALASARSESLKAFGSAELLLEKGIVNPRHIEVQVFGDSHGCVIHLGERDCSIQRRHQKVVEEAPSPAVSPELREKIGQAAVEAARGVGYVGAGTVEFLLDESGQFYFIEMNTRLQVEHPVTEMITGLDLVAWQIAIAEGHPLPLTQAEVRLHGHAIEVRLYAEDPDNQFLPSTGPVIYWAPPEGDGVRVDHGLRSGMTITPYYDAMVAKIITWGTDRRLAIRRLTRALRKTTLLGLTSNQDFLFKTIEHPVFTAGQATTGFIGAHWDAKTDPEPEMGWDGAASAALILYVCAANQYAGSYQNWQSRTASYRFDQDEVSLSITISALDQHRYQIGLSNQNDALEIDVIDATDHQLTVLSNGVRSKITYALDQDGGCWIQTGQSTQYYKDALLAPPEAGDAAGSGKIIAPMPGSVLRIAVSAGDPVSKGETLLILEAMKMEHTIIAPFDGVIESINVVEGQQMQPKEQMLTVVEQNE